MTRTAQYQSSELGLTLQRKAEIIAHEKNLAKLLWRGFRRLGEEFEVWLMLAVNGVMDEKEEDVEASLSEVADVVMNSGVLELLDLNPSQSVLARALGFLRANPEIVPPERRAHLRKVSLERNMAIATKRSWMGRKRTIEDRIGGPGVLWEILSRDEAWWPDNRPRLGYIRAQVYALGVDLSRRSIQQWLAAMMKRPEAAKIAREYTPMEWNEDADKILREILQEPGATRSDGKRRLEYIIERFYMESGIEVSQDQMNHHLRDKFPKS